MKKIAYATIAACALALALAACSSNEADPADTEATTSKPATSSVSGSTQEYEGRPDLTDEQTDTVFLQVLDSYGIDYGTDNGTAAIRMGHTICDGLDRGLSELDIQPGLMEEGPGYSRTQANQFIETSIVAYCPQHG